MNIGTHIAESSTMPMRSSGNRSSTPLRIRSAQPSDYFRRQIRVSSFAYETPAHIIAQMGGTDLLMCCSDYPHSEGTASPIADYDAFGFDREGANAATFFGGNVDFLLRR